MERAVDMRAEFNPFFVDPAQLFHAEHLVAAGVGEDGPVPAHEAVQPACLLDHVDARPKVKVIGVAEDQLDAQLF